ncbi:MAG TPA: hypothetical protein VM103_00460 [Candidatus Paceibacterota bacterium]|nr:hypothetical protein [Candidatus Paceibacterota bacterium]
MENKDAPFPPETIEALKELGRVLEDIDREMAERGFRLENGKWIRIERYT